MFKKQFKIRVAGKKFCYYKDQQCFFWKYDGRNINYRCSRFNLKLSDNNRGKICKKNYPSGIWISIDKFSKNN